MAEVDTAGMIEGMRLPRVKTPREDGDVYRHCFCRTPNGEFLFDDVDKEMYARIDAQVARGCGIELLAYAYLDNHYHSIIYIRGLEPVSDEELLERYCVLFPKRTSHRPEKIEVIAAMLKKNGPEAEAWRKWMLSLCDVSEYQKMVKERFTAWYNRRHGRYGTLWAGRFGDTVLEPGMTVLALMAYVDLNAVRAGIVKDPKDYRFCGYAAAVAGDRRMRKAILQAYGTENWTQAQAAYRMLLFTVGTRSREDAASIAEEHCRRVVKEGAKLTISTLVQCRVSYFTRGIVLGSQMFVAKHMQRLRERTDIKWRGGPTELAATEWGEWASLRAVRRRPGELSLAAATS